MSLYQVQKAIQAVNRDPAARSKFFESPDSFICDFDLTDTERAALTNNDMHALYEMGVHPLLLRPFSIFHGVSELDYLKAIRQGV